MDTIHHGLRFRVESSELAAAWLRRAEELHRQAGEAEREAVRLEHEGVSANCTLVGCASCCVKDPTFRRARAVSLRRNAERCRWQATHLVPGTYELTHHELFFVPEYDVLTDELMPALPVR